MFMVEMERNLRRKLEHFPCAGAHARTHLLATHGAHKNFTYTSIWCKEILYFVAQVRVGWCLQLGDWRRQLKSEPIFGHSTYKNSVCHLSYMYAKFTDNNNWCENCSIHATCCQCVLNVCVSISFSCRNDSQYLIIK